MKQKEAAVFELLLCSLLAAVFPASAAVLTQQSNSPKQFSHRLSWETYWTATGRVESNQAAVDFPFDPSTQEHTLLHSLLRRRRKRIIYGEDDRVRVDPKVNGQKFPYSAEMRVSTGCSGIMITTRHVLTAAHCVHDGSAYLLTALYFLRAGYLEPDGETHWFFVRKFHVPSQWTNMTTETTTTGKSSTQHVYGDWDDYDFAVLEMDSDLRSRRDFIPPGLSGMFCDGGGGSNRKVLHGAGSKVEFVSFPDDKTREALWYVQTDIETESPTLIYFHGDAWHGCSGAGMYSWDYDEESGKYERRVFGVLSGNRNTESSASIQGNFNVAARLNPVNFMLVCHWIGTEEACKQRYSKYLDPERYTDLCK